MKVEENLLYTMMASYLELATEVVLEPTPFLLPAFFLFHLPTQSISQV